MRSKHRKIYYSRHKQISGSAGHNKNNRHDATNICYIAVHSTGTKADILLSELDRLPYHYLVTKAGKLLNLKSVKPQDGTIDIALIGGLDKEGNRVDCRTHRQNETLFNTLVLLSERHRQAKIIAADQLYVYGFANPGFDVLGWIAGYTPGFLQVA